MKTLLTGGDIANLIGSQKPPLVEGYFLLRQQLQPMGFDLSLGKILTPKKIEPIDFSRAKQLFTDGMEEHPFEKEIQPLRPYVLITGETVNMPLNLTAVCITRSSLTRLGAVLGSGIVDAGFRGSLAFSLISTMPIRFRQKDRIAQILFFEHDPTFAYTGQYQAIVR